MRRRVTQPAVVSPPQQRQQLAGRLVLARPGNVVWGGP
ncbi:hypothetical protein BH24ACI5_BH24ACI5_15820 [soil metagenome]